MAHSMFTKVASVIVLVLMFLMMATCFMPLAHGSTSKPRPNSLGLDQTYQNPYVYLVGTIEHVDAFSKATNVTVKPFGSSLIDTETVFLCGDLTKELEDADNTSFYVFTYRMRATRMFDGVPCHDLYRIIQIHFKDGGLD